MFLLSLLAVAVALGAIALLFWGAALLIRLLS